MESQPRCHKSSYWDTHHRCELEELSELQQFSSQSSSYLWLHAGFHDLKPHNFLKPVQAQATLQAQALRAWGCWQTWYVWDWYLSRTNTRSSWFRVPIYAPCMEYLYTLFCFHFCFFVCKYSSPMERVGYDVTKEKETFTAWFFGAMWAGSLSTWGDQSHDSNGWVAQPLPM